MIMSEKLEKAVSLLAEWTKGSSQPTPNRIDISISADDVVAAASALAKVHWGFLSAITGLDQGEAAGKIEALFHFCAGADVLTLRVPLDRAAPTLPSVSSVIPGARVLEWELSEMFGVNVAESQNKKHLYLPDDWPEGLYPMRKDAVIELDEDRLVSRAAV